jgi:hypothetical protein
VLRVRVAIYTTVVTQTPINHEPAVGDYIVLYDGDPDPGEPPVAVLRVTEAGYDAVGEGWPDQAGNLELRARQLAHEHGAVAWRHRDGRYAALPAYSALKDVH